MKRNDEVLSMTPEEAYEAGYTAGAKSIDGGWTPCSVALPAIGEEVDVTYQINGKREVGCGRYIGGEQWIAKYGYGHDDEDGEVLAWKPPTEPYRWEA